MIVHVILCLNEREWFRKRKRKRLINQEDHVSELTFNFHGALSILTFSENEFTLFTKKSKRKTKKKKRKKRWNKEKEKKRKKSFYLSPHVRKVNFVWPCENLSFDTSLYKLMLRVLISRLWSQIFINVSWKIVGQKICKRLINNKHNIACLIIMKE